MIGQRGSSILIAQRVSSIGLASGLVDLVGQRVRRSDWCNGFVDLVGPCVHTVCKRQPWTNGGSSILIGQQVRRSDVITGLVDLVGQRVRRSDWSAVASFFCSVGVVCAPGVNRRPWV